ncbi:hypothetical protein [Azospirillum sp. B4]|uniref:hypothetical protein n=1 Tax=Azospirillum sp. B4 TaxID=95605 RepID=UPI0011DCCF9C|nr:hypothetical protein [Azospirillum sp. B4]
MTNYSPVEGCAIDVMIHIEQVQVGPLTQLVWYYNGVTGDDLSVMANISTSELCFRLDAYTQGFFKFDGATVRRACDDEGVEYPDLTKVSVDDHCVVISDGQQNRQVTVGGVTFRVSPLQSARYGTGYDKSTFESPDPEVTNTGGYEVPPPPHKA